MPDRPAPDPELLREAWDRLVRGEAGDLAALDPADAAVVRRLHALARPPGPDPAFVARLEEDLMRTAVAAVPSPPFPAPGPPDPNGRAPVAVPPGRAPRAASRPARLLAHAALAALLLVVLAAGALVYWPQRPEREPPARLPAAVGSPAATPAADATGGPLVATEFAAGWLPPGPATLLLVRLALDPGVTTDRPPGDFPTGARLDYVAAGSYAVRSDGPLLLLRGGASGADAEAVPPGTEVRLAAGDAVVHRDNAAGQRFGNPGAEPAVVLFAGVLATSLPAPPPGIAAGPPAERLAALAGPVAVELRRAEIGAGAVLPGPEAGAAQLVAAEPGGAGAATLGGRADGSVENLGRDPVAVWVLVLTPAGAATPAA